MINLKNITELPVAESAEGLNLIVNDNGAAKQIAASAVGAQADFSVTDENSPAFIKNKPVEEWDLDLTCDITWNSETSAPNTPVAAVNTGTFENVKNKIFNGVPKIKFRLNRQMDTGLYITQSSECSAVYMPEGVFDENPEMIGIFTYYAFEDIIIAMTLLSDNTVTVMA